MTLDPTLKRLRRYLATRQSAMLKALEVLVRLESPSGNKDAIDRLAQVLAGEWRRRGARVQVMGQAKSGPVLRAEMNLGTKRPAGQLLVIGHLDTVYPLGTLKRMPFRVRAGRAFGPGTVDMKGGLVQALFAAEALRALQLEPARKLVFLFSADEEIGSAVGRPIIEREARRSRAVLVVEPATGPHGALKTARKGVGEFELQVEGRAAHAGVEPEKGVNAIEELAHQIVRLKRLAQPRARHGLTLSVDVIQGGTRTNVIAEHARAVMDVRITRRRDGPWIEKQIRALKPVDRRARLKITGGISRPPLERTREIAGLFRHAQKLARSLGISLEESATGGGSDGNFTAALGIPTLDGLGGVGAGLHSPGEFVLVRRMPERAALLAALLLTL